MEIHSSYDSSDSCEIEFESEAHIREAYMTKLKPAICRKTPDFELVENITIGKSRIYTISIGSVEANYIMKILSTNTRTNTELYTNEIKFSWLSHRNIIVPKFFEANKSLRIKGKEEIASIIISDFACNGDLYRSKNFYKVNFDEKLARTFFRQLISGLDYLHSLNIAHLDLKLENLVLDQDFQLKIIDFDLAVNIRSVDKIRSKGSKSYRAPELTNNTCLNPKAADIYSAAIVLFVLIADFYPFPESKKHGMISLFYLIQNEKEKFWEEFEKVTKKIPKSIEFKRLFEMMTKENPSERASLEQVKDNEWFNGPIYSCKETKNFMMKYYYF